MSGVTETSEDHSEQCFRDYTPVKISDYTQIILLIKVEVCLHNLALILLPSRCHFLLNCLSDEVNRAPI